MKHSLLLSLLMFVCLGVFGKSSSVPPQKVTLDSLQSTIDSQQSTITTLQDSIKDLKEDNAGLHKELKMLEQTIEQYRDYVEKNTSSIYKYLTWWFAVLSIIAAIVVGGLGVLGPYLMNRRSEKTANKAIQQAKDAQKAVEEAQNNLKTFQTKVQQATTQATTATAQAEYARTALANSLKQVQGATNQAIAAQVQAKKAENALKEIQPTVEEAAKKAKAIQYFVQALQESDEKRAVELYDKCICEDEEFAEAYNNRGFLRHKIGGPNSIKAAIDDYTTAITLFDKQGRGIYAEAYNNRGILHFEKQELDEAEKNFDTAILKEYAEAYLNRGLLKYMNGDEYEAKDDFDIAITKKSNFSEAYYIRGLWEYCDYEEDDAINDIIKAKAIKNDVVEVYPNRSFFTGEMKDLDNSFNGVGFSNDMKKLISVPKEKKEPFIILNCVTEIGHEAFDGCANLTSIVIPSGVTEIGSYAFSGCTKLTSIKIPNSVTKIGRGAFAYCINIKEIIVDEDNPSYCSLDGVLYTLDMSQLIAVPGGIVSLVIPDGVNKVGPSSFTGCTSLNSIKIPESVTKIGAYAFRDCTSLTSVEIPDSVTEIGPSAFSRCDNLTEIHLRHKNPNVLKGLLYRPILSKVTLYVPKGSGKAYRNDVFYKRFKEIIEE